MYEAFYGLSEKPFSILPDPAFLYLGKRHSLAYTMLDYGVEHGHGFTVITGGIGCGKTTLIRHLLNNLEQDVTVGLISNTHKEIGELLKWVLLSFDQPYDGDDKVALFDRLQRFLVDEYAQGRRTVLIIDEAQNLAGDTLEELRMLSNINADKDQLLQLVLVGQPQLKDLLRRPELAQFAQRVSSDFHVEALSYLEVNEYIRHRLSVAGRDAPLFEDRAMYVVFKVSGGIPRKVNVLCDTALVYGFSQGAEIITAELVIEVLRDKVEYGVFSSVREGSNGDSRRGAKGYGANRSDDRRRRDDLGEVDGGLQAANEAISDLSAEGSGFGPDVADPLFADAVKIVRESGHGSVSDLQRCLNIRYNRAARLIREMERIGVVSAADERGRREVLAPSLMND